MAAPFDGTLLSLSGFSGIIYSATTRSSLANLIYASLVLYNGHMKVWALCLSATDQWTWPSCYFSSRTTIVYTKCHQLKYISDSVYVIMHYFSAYRKVCFYQLRCTQFCQYDKRGFKYLLFVSFQQQKKQFTCSNVKKKLSEVEGMLTVKFFTFLECDVLHNISLPRQACHASHLCLLALCLPKTCL